MSQKNIDSDNRELHPNVEPFQELVPMGLCVSHVPRASPARIIQKARLHTHTHLLRKLSLSAAATITLPLRLVFSF